MSGLLHEFNSKKEMNREIDLTRIELLLPMAGLLLGPWRFLQYHFSNREPFI